MTAIAQAAPVPRQGLRGSIVGLVALVVFINYVDRGNLATAAPLIQGQLKLSPTQLGVLLSAFFWTYTPSQILAGWMAERINPYRTLALGLAVWSIATVLSGLAGGFVSLLALRLLLGLGESAAFPCSSKLFAAHLPAARLGRANGLVAVGLALGPAFGTLVGGLMMASLGWRPVFIVFGLASLAWLWPWLRATRHVRSAPATEGLEPEPGFAALLGRRALWGAGLGHFCGNYVFYFVISWLPLYLVKTHGLSLGRMSELGGLIYLVYAASCLATGWLSDRALEAGADASVVRKSVSVASQLGAALAMLGCVLGDAGVSVIALFGAAIAFGLNTPTIYAIGQTLAGPRAGGKWMGVQNGIGNLAGIIAPLVTGVVVERTGQFSGAFAIAGAMALAGALCWGLVVPRIEPIDWSSRPSPPARLGRAGRLD